MYPAINNAIQARWRSYATDMRRARAHAAALLLQAAARGFVERRRCAKLRAARLVQAVSRGFLARLRYGRALEEQAKLRAREVARKEEELRYAHTSSMYFSFSFFPPLRAERG